MAIQGGVFNPEEIAYLRTLPAVRNVTPNRIMYTEAFKRACLRRYLAGDSPVGMFREAGLPPEIVGYKRIERAFARWKAESERILAVADDGDGEGRRFIDADAADVGGAGDFGAAFGNAPDAAAYRDAATGRAGEAMDFHDDEGRAGAASGRADDSSSGRAGMDDTGAAADGAASSKRNVTGGGVLFPMRSRLTGDPSRFDMRDILIGQQIRRISELEHEVADLKARLAGGE